MDTRYVVHSGGEGGGDTGVCLGEGHPHMGCLQGTAVVAPITTHAHHFPQLLHTLHNLHHKVNLNYDYNNFH